MKTETIKQYTILYQYLLLLKEPLYIFLVQIFQHLAPETWWENFIEPVLKRHDKENFKYLDIADLLNVFKMNWNTIFKYLDNDYHKSKYNNKYKIVYKVHGIRHIVAHANDIEMSPLVLSQSLAYLLDFSKIINAKKELIRLLEQSLAKYSNRLPPEPPAKKRIENNLKEKILSIIEKKVLFKAISCDTLEPDIKLSVDRTTLRIHSMRTIEEIMGFFNNAIKSERGIAVENALHDHGLLGFDDIKDEVNQLYYTMIDLN